MFVNSTVNFFVRTILILIFAPVFGGFSIVPLWNRKKTTTSVDRQFFGIENSNVLQRTNFYYRRFETNGLA